MLHNLRYSVNQCELGNGYMLDLFVSDCRRKEWMEDSMSLPAPLFSDDVSTSTFLFFIPGYPVSVAPAHYSSSYFLDISSQCLSLQCSSVPCVSHERKG